MPLASVKFADSIQQGLNSLIGFIPNVIGFLIILLVGYIIAKLVKTAITKGLQALKVDRHLHDSDAGQYVERVSPGASPSKPDRRRSSSGSSSCSPSRRPSAP